MNRNLNPQEFEQAQLFDDVLGGYAIHGPPYRPEYAPKFDYPDPHAGEGLAGEESVRNPIYSDTAGDNQDLSRMTTPREEWVPTSEVRSVQTAVNPTAVEHLQRHATGLHEGNATVVRGGGEHVVFDGNHRLNAALRRGQLLAPADVYDVD